LRSFEELLDPVYPDAVRFARGLAGSAPEGDDLLQDALIRAWKGFPRLREPGRFKPWLLRIIRNVHRSRARRRRLVQWLSLSGADQVAVPEGISFEAREVVRLALTRVPRSQREAIVLFEVLGMSIDEIAEIQGTTSSAVKSRLSRGRGKLREAYERLSRWEGESCPAKCPRG
jgi:RNA polymerase sigma-70 factor (ECF subfamily)